MQISGKNEILDFSLMTNGVDLPNTGGVRGMLVLPGGTDALWVVGEAVILTRAITAATQSPGAQFSKTYVGSQRAA